MTITGTSGTRAIATRYPVTSGLTAETTKQEGRISNLVAQNADLTRKEFRKGLG